MPSRTKAQQHLFAAAAHGATFKKAQDLRNSMSMQQLLDFARLAPKAKPKAKK